MSVLTDGGSAQCIYIPSLFARSAKTCRKSGFYIPCRRSHPPLTPPPPPPPPRRCFAPTKAAASCPVLFLLLLTLPIVCLLVKLSTAPAKTFSRFYFWSRSQRDREGLLSVELCAVHSTILFLVHSCPHLPHSNSGPI